MAWPQFMSSPFPSSANSNHTLKPSNYFLNPAADRPANNGFRSSGIEDQILRNAFEDGARGSDEDGSGFREVTLEDYLSKPRVRAEDVKTGVSERGEEMGIGDGEKARGRKRAVMESADRAALQRQKRMIKNRESAARSRERKQLYTNQLEQTVFKLEEENAMLLKEREKLLALKFKELVEHVMPVDERKNSEKALRRTNSFP